MLGTSVAHAEMLKFHANMVAGEETPATTSKGKVTADVTVDTDKKNVMWTVKVDGLTGAATAALIDWSRQELSIAPSERTATRVRFERQAGNLFQSTTPTLV